MTWLKANWKRILIGFVILLALAAVYIFFPVREDLSSLKDRAANYDIKILRDTYGVPHIFGHTDADAAYGLAYAHSEDDFLTIQQVLMAARNAEQSPLMANRQLKPVWFDEADIRANLECEYVPGEEK